MAEMLDAQWLVDLGMVMTRVLKVRVQEPAVCLLALA